MNPLVTSVTEDGVARVRLDRPSARNALSTAMIETLTAIVRECESDAAVRVVLLSSTSNHFAAGADVKEMLPLGPADVLERDLAGSCTFLATMEKPIVLAVEGFAFGGGCEIVEMCDVVLASETATFAHPEIKLGTMPGAGGTQRLAQAIGRARALDLLLTGRPLTAVEAHAAGLVSRVVPPERLEALALEVAQQIASLSAPVVQRIKRAVTTTLEGAITGGLERERRLFHETFTLEDRTEGMTAFVERRSPTFSHR